MAVANTFIFGSASSSTYGVVIEGPGDYSAPSRAVEEISIPGRNGAFMLDKGYYKNIEVEYKVLIQNTSQSAFETSVSSFRNAIVSQIGYQRLTDTYHPNEYRMAMYSGGFDEDPEFHGKGAVFKVKFSCKPQRFLTSGETKSSVANNGTVTNPTLFASSPMIEVEGYGNLSFNGYTISIENSVMGEILLANSKTFSTNSTDIIFNKLSYETGDTITMGTGTINWDMRTINGYRFWYTEVTPTDSNSAFHSVVSLNEMKRAFAITGVPAITFTAGTNKTVTNTVTATFPIGLTQDAQSNITVTCTQTITYTASYSSTQSRIRIQYTLSFSSSGKLEYSFSTSSSKTGDVTVNSTQSLLGHPTYIDCDLGEAYKVTSGVYVSLNSKINLGSRLPTLASGSNTVTYDNTMTSVKITPRWWKV